jgi:hypothetical protein
MMTRLELLCQAADGARNRERPAPSSTPAGPYNRIIHRLIGRKKSGLDKLRTCHELPTWAYNPARSCRGGREHEPGSDRAPVRRPRTASHDRMGLSSPDANGHARCGRLQPWRACCVNTQGAGRPQRSKRRISFGMLQSRCRFRWPSPGLVPPPGTPIQVAVRRRAGWEEGEVEITWAVDGPF